MKTNWILDVVVGLSAIIIFGIMLLWLPKFVPNPFGYVASFLVFIAYLTVMGLTVVRKQVGENPVKQKKTNKD